MSKSTRTQNSRRRLSRAMVHAGLMAATLAFGSAAQAAAEAQVGITFTFDYGTTDTGDGFWDPSQRPVRRGYMDTAASMFSDMFGSHFTNSATILLSATATNLPSSSNLASAGSSYQSGSGPGFTAKGVAQTKALSNVDLNGAAADGSINVNFGQPWSYSPTTAVPAGQYDFYSTIFHEFTHVLGFASSIGQTGDPFFGTKSAGQWVTFDQFLVDKNGNKVINPATFCAEPGYLGRRQCRWRQSRCAACSSMAPTQWQLMATCRWGCTARRHGRAAAAFRTSTTTTLLYLPA